MAPVYEGKGGGGGIFFPALFVSSWIPNVIGLDGADEVRSCALFSSRNSNTNPVYLAKDLFRMISFREWSVKNAGPPHPPPEGSHRSPRLTHLSLQSCVGFYILIILFLEEEVVQRRRADREARAASACKLGPGLACVRSPPLLPPARQAEGLFGVCSHVALIPKCNCLPEASGAHTRSRRSIVQLIQ